jgi:hypothetical protein
MRKILFLLALFASIKATAQVSPSPFYIPNNPDSIILVVNVNGVQRRVYNIDLAKLLDTSKLHGQIVQLNGGKLDIADTTQYQKGIKDKKWVIFGDSFSTTPGLYYGRVDSLLGLTGTVTNAVSGNRYFQQSAKLDSIISVNPNYFKSFDIASILLGVNDYALRSTIGTFNDTANSPTVAGYLKNMIEKILISNPYIKLYVMTPPNANGAGVDYKGTNPPQTGVPGSGWSFKNLENLILQITSYYGIQSIDLYNMAQFNLKTIPYYTNDGLHPNYYGSIILAKIIANAFLHDNNNGKVDVPALTNGAILFADGNGIRQDSVHLNWDSLNNRLNASQLVATASQSGTSAGLWVKGQRPVGRFELVDSVVGGNFASSIVDYYITNRTNNTTLLGQLGLLGRINLGGTPSIDYLYMGAGSGTTYGNNAVRFYPDLSTQFFGTLSTNGNSIVGVTESPSDSSILGASTGFVKRAIGNKIVSNTATLVSGTVTVACPQITATSKITVTIHTPGGTQGFISVPTRTAGTSFVINSTSATETSTVDWTIIN